MLVVKEELFKLLYKKRGLFLLIVFSVLKIGMSFSSYPGAYVNRSIEDSKKVYCDFLKQVEGKLTKEKENYIKGEVEKYHNAEEQVMRGIESFLAKKSSMTDYVAVYQKNKAVLDKKDSIDALKAQLEYVKENPKERFFMYQNGWTYLFSNMKIDWLLYLLLLIMMSQVFCTEYDTKMDSLNLVCINGRGKLYFSKIFVSLLWTVLCVSLFGGIEIFTAIKRYGLPHADFPIGSIFYFEDQPMKISIGSMLLISYGIKLLAGITFSIIVLFSSLVSKSTIRTVFLSLFMIGIPYFIFTEKQSLMLAAPISFIMQQGYLHGIFNMESGVWECLNSQQLVFNCLKVILYMIIMVGIGYILNMKMSFKIGKRKKKGICIGMCMILLCTGCKQTSYKAMEQINYSILNYFFINDRYVVDSCTQPFVLIDRETGEETPLFHDVFMENDDFNAIELEYMTNDFLYFSVKYPFGDYEIKRMDLSTFEEETVYKKLKNRVAGVDFLGLMDSINSEAERWNRKEYTELKRFWLVEKELYVIEGEYLYCIDMGSGKRELLVKKRIPRNVAIEGQYIYYIDEQYLIYQYDMIKKEEKRIGNELGLDIRVMNDMLVIGGLDGSIGIYDLGTDKYIKVIEKDGNLMDVSGEYIYFMEDEHAVFFVDYSGKGLKQIYTTDKTIQQFKAVDGERYEVALIGDDLTAPPVREEYFLKH